MPIAFSVAGVGVVAVVGAVVYLMWRRRRRADVPGAGPSLGPAVVGVGTMWKREVPDMPVVYTQEMEGSAVIHEL